jgi:hypothetical protein
VFDVEIGVDVDGSADGFPTEAEDESEEGDLTMSDDTGEDE